MSALAGLVEKGLVAPDWAEALAPVDDRIAAMGGFLREEVAAGRGYQPAGDLVLRAFQRPLADLRGGAARVAAAAQPAQHLRRAA
jgi:uracil-DNA glycosylase